MFDILNPASSITELYEYLSKEHNKYYCYRGQVKEYDFLVPSLYRKHIVSNKTYLSYENDALIINDNYIDSNGVQHFGFLPVDATTDNFDELALIKLKEMRRLIKEFGGNIGNIFAQQYGLSSESIDITSNLDVACFFATHDYPTYDLYNDDNELGVIYRFKMQKTNYSFAGIEQIKNMLFDLTSPYPYLFSLNENSLDDDEFNNIKSKYHLSKKIKGFTPFIMIDYYQIERIIESYISNNKSCKFLKEHLRNSRLYRQKGGYILPAKYFDSVVPEKSKPIYIDKLRRTVMKPGFAINQKMIGIDDSSKYSFVEKFYFKHNSLQNPGLKVTKEYLWPSLEDDYIFYLIACMVSIANNDYLKMNNISFDDRFKGIIDRGYY